MEVKFGQCLLISDVSVASPVMIDGSESMENVGDETEN